MFISLWQMVQAYRLPRLGLVLTAGMGVITLAILAALPIIQPVFYFPKPAGPYAIGTLTYHLTDSNRAEIFSADAVKRRELMVQIWYPAKTSKQVLSPPLRAPYVQDASALANALSRLKNLPAVLFRQFKHVTTHAVAGSPVADDKPSYPVLIFLEGAIGFRQMNTFQVEALVSQGYIVAALDQPYTAAVVVFPNGREVSALPIEQMIPLIRQSHSPTAIAPTLHRRTFEEGIVPYLARDVSFTLGWLDALNQADPNRVLTGRLNLQQVGTFGVSLGGIVASEACRLEARLRACLFMDAPMPMDVVKSGLQQPALWITRDV